MKLTKNSSGFSLVETLFVILALSLISFAGFYALRAHTNATKTTPTPKLTTPVADTGIVLSSWNVTIPLSDKADYSTSLDADTYSVIKANVAGCNGTYYVGSIKRYVASEKIMANTPDASIYGTDAVGKTWQAVLMSANGGDNGKGVVSNFEAYAGAKVIGSYVYQFNGPQSQSVACSSSTMSETKAQEAITGRVLQAFLSLKPTS